MRSIDKFDGGIHGAIEDWSARLRGDIAVNVTSLSRRASTAPYPPWLSATIREALISLGIRQPYHHQVQAWDLLNGGDDIVVATPTASGKTLCYNAPVLAALESDPAATALYMFPTKALARDQEASVRLLLSAAGLDAPAVVYDGDTSGEVRRAAREEARIIITNPDMLHTGILPHHASWTRFFGGLSQVVVDEVHQYRGVFGSHVANVIRRLRRVCDFHGSAPRFAACSATIGNPDEHAACVLGRGVSSVSTSGAPVGPRTFIIYNPEVVDPVLGIRKSAMRVAAGLASDLVDRSVVTLVFCQSRRGVEITLRYMRDRMKRSGRDPERVRGYRGGYLPSLRREIETSLREGRLDAVVATNALELGIDVGELDAVVLAGYPGTIAATHQRSGRAGRRQEPSLSVLVAGSSPLDQFLVRNPSFLMDTSPEMALVQPDNIEILIDHVKCAAFEIPFENGERFGRLEAADTQAVLDALEQDGDLKRSGTRYHFIKDSYPAAEVGLRNIGQKRFVAVDASDGQPIAEVDAHMARRELHEHAVYQHDGDTYEVVELDQEAGRARLQPVEPVYYTTVVEQVRLEVVEEHTSRPAGGGVVTGGDVRVTEEITGYKKIRFKTHENLGHGQVKLPPATMETESTWFSPNPRDFSDWKRDALLAAMDGARAAIHQVASLRLMCDPRDIASTIYTRQDVEDTGGEPGIYLYDSHHGGVGLSERAFEEADTIAGDALRLVEGCPCPDGCPACVGPNPVDARPIKDSAAQVLLSLVNDGQRGAQ